MWSSGTAQNDDEVKVKKQRLTIPIVNEKARLQKQPG